jgi:hypothetical protein
MVIQKLRGDNAGERWKIIGVNGVDPAFRR